MLNPGRREDRFGKKRQCVGVLGTLIIRRSQIKGESGNTTQKKFWGEDREM